MTPRPDARTVDREGEESRDGDEGVRVPRGRSTDGSGSGSVLRHAHRGVARRCHSLRGRDRRVPPARDHGAVPDPRPRRRLRAPGALRAQRLTTAHAGRPWPPPAGRPLAAGTGPGAGAAPAGGDARLLLPAGAGADRARPPGWVAPVRPVLLLALSAGRPSGPGGAQLDGARRLPVRERRRGPVRREIPGPRPTDARKAN